MTNHENLLKSGYRQWKSPLTDTQDYDYVKNFGPYMVSLQYWDMKKINEKAPQRWILHITLENYKGADLQIERYLGEEPELLDIAKIEKLCKEIYDKLK